MSYEHTFAGIDTLEPRVVEVRVTGLSAVLVPITAGVATTDFTGFLVQDARGTHRGPDCRRKGLHCDCWCAGCSCS